MAKGLCGQRILLCYIVPKSMTDVLLQGAKCSLCLSSLRTHTVDMNCECCKDQTTFALHSSISNTRSLWHTGCLVFTLPPLPSFLLCLLPSSISLPSQIEFQSTLKPLEDQSVKTKPYFFPFFFFFFFYFKRLAGPAGTGSSWHALAHVGPHWQESGTDSMAAKS